jgi:nucleoid DNA-binding protein
LNPLPNTRERKNTIINMINIIFAIQAAEPATLENPKTAAIIAIIKKRIVHFSITSLFV